MTQKLHPAYGIILLFEFAILLILAGNKKHDARPAIDQFKAKGSASSISIRASDRVTTVYP